MTKTEKIITLLQDKDAPTAAADIAKKVGCNPNLVYAVKKKQQQDVVAPLKTRRKRKTAGKKGHTLTVASSSPANSKQVGGTHYKKMKIQPWDAMQEWLTPEEFRGFLKGNAIKYLARAKQTNNKDDHAKAAHYMEKLAEVS